MINCDTLRYLTARSIKYLLSGLLHKATAPGWGGVSLTGITLPYPYSSSKAYFNPTDIYGTLVSARLFVPDNLEKLDPRWLSLHHFRRFVDDGSYPMVCLINESRGLVV